MDIEVALCNVWSLVLSLRQNTTKAYQWWIAMFYSVWKLSKNILYWYIFVVYQYHSAQSIILPESCHITWRICIFKNCYQLWLGSWKTSTAHKFFTISKATASKWPGELSLEIFRTLWVWLWFSSCHILLGGFK